MPSIFDQRRKELSGMNTESQGSGSIFDSRRAELQSMLQQQNNPPAAPENIQTEKSTTPKLSSWQKYKQANPNTPNILKPIGFALETPWRIPFVARMFNSAGKTMTGGNPFDESANIYKTDTGNKVANTVADFVGAGIGMKGSTQYKQLGELGNIGENLVGQGLNKLGVNTASKLGQYGLTGLRGAGEMGTLGGIESGLNGADTKDTLKSIRDNALMGAAFGVGSKAVSEALPNILKAAVKTKTYEDGIKNPDGILKPIPKPVEPILKPGKYSVKNIELEKAYQNYDEAMKDVQNQIGHYKLTDDEILNTSIKLGIDPFKLIDNIDKAASNPVKLSELGERARISQIAGVGSDFRPLRNNSPNSTVKLRTEETPNIFTKIKSSVESPNESKVFNKSDYVKSKQVDTETEPNIFKYAPRPVEGSKVRLNNKEYTVGKQQFDGQINLLSKDGKSKLLVPPEYIKSVSGNGIEKPQFVKMSSNNGIQPSSKIIDANIVKQNPLKDLSITLWKDKSMPSFNRETIERNFEDIAGDDAVKLKETFVNPIKENETNAIRQKTALRDSIKEYDIKAGSHDSELAQKYGEGEITLEQLKDWTDNWENVKNMADHMRNTYDQLITTANDVLKRNNMKPISIRENYMPHQGEMDSIMKTLGLEVTDLPTEINGLTPDFNPNKNFFANALQRKGDRTVYDAVRGFDNYVEGITKIIHHTDDIGRLRALEKAIREHVGEGTHLNNFVAYLKNYTNQIAGKQSRLDRGSEEVVGRRVYKIADAVRKQVSANMVGGNVSSALTNFIPLTQSLATTDKASFVKGMLDTITNITRNDGFPDKSSFLTRRSGSDKLVMSSWQKIGKGANWIFKVVDDFVGQTIVRSKYLEGIKNGLPEEAAMKKADDWAGRIMADRSLGMTPTLLNNKIISLIAPFQTEVNNQMSFLFKDLPRTYTNKTELASKVAQITLYSYLFNNLYEKLMGRRPAFDVLGVIQNAYEDYNNDKLKTTDANKNLINNVVGQLPFAGTFFGGGRIPITNALPSLTGIATGVNDVKTELSKPLFYLIPPTGGGQIKKTLQGLEVLKNKGAYNDDKTQLKYPIADNNINKAKALVFGPSGLPETQDYYKNNLKPLTTEQTKDFNKKVSEGKEPINIFKDFNDKRQLNSIKNDISDVIKSLGYDDVKQQNTTKFANKKADMIIKNPELSQSEKIELLKQLKAAYK